MRRRAPNYRPPFKYDWQAIQAFYDEGKTLSQCRERFGFAKGSWQKARLRGDITNVRSVKKPLHELLRRASSRTTIKARLIREGFLQNKCGRCGISEWCGKPLSVQIDHINGINDDYRLENLRMLCPNCHSLTETHGHRNRKPRQHGVPGGSVE